MYASKLFNLPLADCVNVLTPLLIFNCDAVNAFNALNVGCCEEVNVFNLLIELFQLALSTLYPISSTRESIMFTLNALKSDGVIAPLLLSGNEVLLSTFKACFDNSDISFFVLI